MARIRETATRGAVGESEGIDAEQASDPLPEEGATGETAEKRSNPLREKKIKMGICFTPEFKKRLIAVSNELNLAPGEVIHRVMWPLLRGSTRPRLSNDLKALFPRESNSAA